MLFLGTAGTAHAVTYSNTAPIAINDRSVASPYPSAISVSGVVGTVAKVTPVLHGFHHTDMQDVDMVLQSPRGVTVVLMSDAGSQEVSPFAPIDLAFDDSSIAIPCGGPAGPQPAAGTYAPTDYGPGTCGGPGADSFPAPAPQGQLGHALSPLSGADPNGTWQLWVVDQYAPDSGAIDGGWRLLFAVVPGSLSSAPRISGTPEVRHKVTATSGTVASGIAAYQWKRCNLKAARCKAIRGATKATYKLVKADRGHRLVVSETAVSSGGNSQPRSSKPTAPVGPPLISVTGAKTSRLGVTMRVRSTSAGVLRASGIAGRTKLRAVKRKLRSGRRTTIRLVFRGVAPSGATAKIRLTVVDASHARSTKRVTVRTRT